MDNCPDTPNPDQLDSDSDGTGDQCDNCPNDSDKTEPGLCGCGAADIDSDEDGFLQCIDDCNDNDPDINPGATEVCGDGVDNNCDDQIDEGCGPIPGDLDYDGDIDYDDFNIFLPVFGKCDGQPDYNSDCDYDGDNCITFIDYQMWYGYYLNQ